MFIIYIAHCRGNVLYYWIPARYGLSDAANLFVFVSGMTASIAFGGTFTRQGWLIGTARIAYRCLQLYAAQIGMFFAIAVVLILGTHLSGGTDYVAEAGFQRFFAETPQALVGLFTLSYVPHNIDILPLYIVALALVPVAMAMARIDPRLVLAASVALYLAANFWQLNFPAQADDQPDWYFDPLAWQLIFFTGYALRSRWITVPLDSRLLFSTSVAILVVGLAISLPFVFERIGPIDWLRQWIYDHSNKTYLDPLQYGHFLASAYVAVVLLRGREHILLTPALRPVVKSGQQALSIFTSGMALSYVGGMVFDHAGTGLPVQLAVNGVTFAVLVAIAYGVAWFKDAPWKRRAGVTAAVANVLVVLVVGPASAGELELRTLNWQATERSYLLRVPAAAAADALPLVVALHGAGGTAAGFADETGIAAAAVAKGMMAALPNGTAGAGGRLSFNAQICCGDAVVRRIDDVGFIGAVIDDVARHRTLDRSRVYATGMSNGGMLAHQLAAMHPEWFAAIAPVAAAIGGMTRHGQTYLLPMPEMPVPVLMIHGMRDRLVLYDGGSSPVLNFPHRWKMSVADAVGYWAAVDRCADPPERSAVTPGRLLLTAYDRCDGGSAVRLWTIVDGEHAWPDAIFPAANGSRSAAAEILAFFSGFRRVAVAAGSTP